MDCYIKIDRSQMSLADRVLHAYRIEYQEVPVEEGIGSLTPATLQSSENPPEASEVS